MNTGTERVKRGMAEMQKGGVIMCRKTWAQAIDKAIFPGAQGGPLMHVITAKAVALGEALQPDQRSDIKKCE